MNAARRLIVATLCVLVGGLVFVTASAVAAPPEAPEIAGESVSDVLSTGAMLEAQIDPMGEDTHYYFQYGTSSCTTDPSVCTDAPAAPGSDIGSGESDRSVSFELKGLTPGTTYHYRVLASNALGNVEGADHTFITPALTGPSSEGCPNEQLRAEQPYGLTLPDCRAYEMVSPVEKAGYDAINLRNPISRAAVSGEALMFKSYGAFAGTPASRFETEYIARRGPDGWSTQSIVPPYESHNIRESADYETMLFTPELSAGIAETDLPNPGALSLFNVYLVDLADGSYQSLTGPLGGTELQGGWDPAGASTDLSKVVLAEGTELTGGKAVATEVANDGESLSGVVGGGQPSNPRGAPAEHRWHAVSADGSRVIFTHADSLYARENIGQPQSPVEGSRCTVPTDACTVEVSASQRTPEDPDGALQLASYWGASADGSKVLFTSNAELTNEAYTGPADNAANLYEYDLEDGQLTDLTVDKVDADGAEAQGVVKISEDGSSVYFVADGALDGEGESGQPNLYVSHDGGAPTFIATLSTEDGEDWKESVGSLTNRDSLIFHSAAVSPDGTRLAFMSVRSLTGYDTQDLGTGQPDSEVYLYDAETKTLACASCNPSGARPIGPSSLPAALNLREDDYVPRDFSEDGSRLFFQSSDALVSQDSNGLQDVYEYTGGHVYPISDMAGGHASFFLDASASGNDVFIATADQLLPQDRDNRIDVYDARVDGGFPVTVAPPPCENGDSCKPPPTPQPAVFGAPASATFSGAGNPPPTTVAPAAKPKPKKKAVRCTTGQKLNHGKCVKRKHAKKAKKPAKGRK